MERPIKVAACPIYFGANGGQFTELGTADVQEDDRLLCPIAFDCGKCGFLHRWLSVQVANGFSATWECVHCIKKSKSIDASNNVERIVTGYYQAGRKNDDPESPDYDEDRPGLSGCTHVLEWDESEATPSRTMGQECGWESSLLQLVLRKRRADGR
jgi:hypothetical protein